MSVGSHSCDLHMQVSVLDYQSTQLKLLPLLATAYCLHFTKDHLVKAAGTS